MEETSTKASQRAQEAKTEGASTAKPKKQKKAAQPPRIDQRIASLAEAAKAGRLGHGLTLKARLGDDFEAVTKAASR